MSDIPLSVLITPYKEIIALCQQSKIGKKLPNALYIHLSAISALATPLQRYEQQARKLLPEGTLFTLIKFNYDRPTISYLHYPNFDTDPHPALSNSTQVNLTTQTVKHRDYSKVANRPILHRKETFVTPDYPHYLDFQQLTHQEDAITLLNHSQAIGTQQGWQQRLQERQVKIVGHQVIPLQFQQKIQPKIDRHKAAIHRTNFSKPVRLALEAGLFTPETSFLDYGCGHGSDVKLIAQQGFSSSGWDPHYQSDTDINPAAIVNLGYVINVIETPTERREALIKAWELTQQVLIVAAQVLIQDSSRGQIAYSDGVISSRNTFQKYYEQEELKSYIDQVLGVDAIPVALGIYFIFRDAAQAQNFRASRFRSRATTPTVRLTTKRFEDYQGLLSPLIDFFTKRGRLPIGDELSAFTPLLIEFGTVRRAFNIIVQASNQEEWDIIADKRRQDILVYLALSNFDHPYKRLKLSQLPIPYQTDIKSLFGSYRSAWVAAELMLMNLGRSGFIADCCHHSKIGYLNEQALYVHISALESLDIMLRLYEGCASRTIGRLDKVTLIKFHLHKPKITYLFYPDFDFEPHPKLHTAMQIDLSDLQVHYHDYTNIENPPVFYNKNACVLADYP
jgi:DNA phosphorothioation-associated putative methyltransferase